MEYSTIQNLMETKELIHKILELGYTKYRLAKEIGVSWHCIHAYQNGWYNAGLENWNKLEDIKERLIRATQLELFEPIKLHNNDVMDAWLEKNLKKTLTLH